MTIFDSVRMKCRTLLEAVNELFAMGGELEQKVDNQEEELVNMQSVMGDVQAGFSDVRDEMDTLTDRVDTVEQTYDPEQLNTIKGDISAIEDDIQLLTAGVNGTQSRMDDVEESNAQAVATVQELSETVATYDSEIANLKSTDTNTMQQVLAQGVELDNEVTARTNGDTALRTSLDTEIETRTNQIGTLTTNLNNEVTARTNADTTIQGALDTLDESVVKLTGDQTITGGKTFNRTEAFKVSAVAPYVTLQATGIEKGVTGFQYISPRLVFRDVNSNQMGHIGMGYNTVLDSSIAMTVNNLVGGDDVSATMSLKLTNDGDKFATVPSPSNSSDNSDKVATTAWVNTASGVVHTTGNENVAGYKTFSSPVTVSRSLPGIKCIDPNIPEGGAPTDKNRYADYSMHDVGGISRGHLRIGAGTTGSGYLQLVSKNISGKEALIHLTMPNEGDAYLTVPATRTTGYATNEVATAGWVDAKLQALEARITTLEGGA